MDLAARKPKLPMMAKSIGGATDDAPPPDAGGGDDEEKALAAGGDALIAAMHAGDSLSIARAVVAIMSASGGEDDNPEASDLDRVGGKDFSNDGHEED